MHLSENALSLKKRIIRSSIDGVINFPPNLEFIILPYYKSLEEIPNSNSLINKINTFISRTNESSTIAILTSSLFANEICTKLNDDAHLKLWIAVKLTNPIERKSYLTDSHSALLILTRYKSSLKHTKTRIGYTYCPICKKTTKDYGGKKHLYHEFGTLVSDVWRDITVDFDNYPSEIINRLSDLFGISQYEYINVYDQREYFKPNNKETKYKIYLESNNVYLKESTLLLGDCIEQLRNIPDNSIDFCFSDPPYNLNKKYENWDDNIDTQKYFEWCDQWLSELARVLKPGHTLAVLNIPQGGIRHFKHLIGLLDYQDWIVWEGLSMPVRMIMPSHYSIICFSKGQPRELPALSRNHNSILEKNAIEIKKENYCIRSSCITKRKRLNIKDAEFTSNIWSDIHRLKHNSQRVNHPCQLPPMIMYRLISLFTNENEIVLDPFNGAGTTTLAAQQLNRKYVGIEYSEIYHGMAIKRHEELTNGINPFHKIKDDGHKVKNSRVERLKKQKYKVSKKVLQLEIKNISKKIGHIPSKEEVVSYSKYPIEYYENYFASWGEVTAAARTTGMTEFKKKINSDYEQVETQLKLFDKSNKYKTKRVDTSKTKK